MAVKVIPVKVGALGTIAKKLKQFLSERDLDKNSEWNCRKLTSYILQGYLQNVLEI